MEKPNVHVAVVVVCSSAPPRRSYQARHPATPRLVGNGGCRLHATRPIVPGGASWPATVVIWPTRGSVMPITGRNGPMAQFVGFDSRYARILPETICQAPVAVADGPDALPFGSPIAKSGKPSPSRPPPPETRVPVCAFGCCGPKPCHRTCWAVRPAVRPRQRRGSVRASPLLGAPHPQRTARGFGQRRHARRDELPTA